VDFFAAAVPSPFAAVAIEHLGDYLGEEGETRVRVAYGGNYQQLAALRRKYDSTNFFRLNQNIAPASR
jgi:hypothetical protein